MSDRVRDGERHPAMEPYPDTCGIVGNNGVCMFGIGHDGPHGWEADATSNRMWTCPRCEKETHYGACPHCGEPRGYRRAIPNRATEGTFRSGDRSERKTPESLGADATANRVQAGPAQKPNPNAERAARAQLRQAVWDVSQFLDPADVRDYVERVLAEIESDEP